jgi:hypothetical protein
MCGIKIIKIFLTFARFQDIFVFYFNKRIIFIGFFHNGRCTKINHIVGAVPWKKL